MPSTRTLLVAALVPALALAGCVGVGGDDTGDAAAPSATDAPTDQAPAPAGDGPAAEANRTPLAFPGDAAEATFWANDTFGPTETCRAGGCQTGDAYRDVALQDHLPDGVPARVEATLTYDASQSVFASPLDLYVLTEDADVYTLEGTAEPGTDELAFTVLGGAGDVTLRVQYRWPNGQEPEVGYALEVDIEADPAVAPEGATAAVDLAPGDTVQAEAAGDGSAILELRGPDDRRLAREAGEDGTAEVTVPSSAAAGEHVLLVQQDSAPLRLTTDGNATELRALGLEVQASDVREPTPGETLTFEETVDAPPTAVAAYTTEARPVGASASEGTVTVEAPGGTVVDGAFGCSLCLTSGYTDTAWSATSDAALDAGTYTVTYEPGAEAGYGVGLLVETYQR